MAFHEERMDISAAVHSENLLVLYIQSHFLGDYTLVSAIREAQEGLRILVIDESTATLSDEYSPVGGDAFFKALNNFVAKVQPRKFIIVERNLVDEADSRKYIDVGEVFTSCVPWLPQMNLQLQILGNETDPGYTTVKKVLKENPVSTLIYTSMNKRQHDLARYLRHSGFDAQALIVNETTRKILEASSESKLPILIATSRISTLLDKHGMCKTQPSILDRTSLCYLDPC